MIIKYEFPHCSRRRENESHEKHVLDVCLALTNQVKISVKEMKPYMF